MYEIAVCDDNMLDRRRLIKHINSNANLYEMRIYEFNSGVELLKAMKDIISKKQILGKAFSSSSKAYVCRGYSFCIFPMLLYL